MIVNMSATATEEQIQHVMDRIKECGFLPHLIQGAERTVIGVVGKNRGRRSEVEALRVKNAHPAGSAEKGRAYARPFPICTTIEGWWKSPLGQRNRDEPGRVGGFHLQ